jgi:hypothetical protein
LKRWALERGLLVIGAMPIMGPSSFSSFLFIPGHELSSFGVPHAPYHDVLPFHRLKVMGPTNCGLNPLKLCAKINLSLYKVIILSVCYSNGKLTQSSF